MKMRNGFVSNSSSSSFIINGKIDKVAKSMLKTVIEDFSDWGDKKATKKELAQYKMWQENLKVALKNKDVQEGKIGITMPSCNYETYIIKVGDEVHVSTANNHDWDLDYMRCGGGADEGEADIVYNSIEDADFFNVRNQLIHSKEMYNEKDDDLCTDCDMNYGCYVICNGKMLCAECYTPIVKK